MATYSLEGIKMGIFFLPPDPAVLYSLPKRYARPLWAVHILRSATPASPSEKDVDVSMFGGCLKLVEGTYDVFISMTLSMVDSH
jgi:hypothetical protein